MGRANQNVAVNICTNVQQNTEVSRTSLSPTAEQESENEVEEERATEDNTVTVARRILRPQSRTDWPQGMTLAKARVRLSVKTARQAGQAEILVVQCGQPGLLQMCAVLRSEPPH